MAPRIFFRVPLTCPHCGTPNEARSIDLSSTLGQDPEWVFAEPGEALDLSVGDFENDMLTLRLPDANTIVALELWTCSSCRALAPARVEFRVRTPDVVELVGAAVVSLTTDVLAGAHFITRDIEEWTPRPGEDEARIEELKRRR